MFEMMLGIIGGEPARIPIPNNIDIGIYNGMTYPADNPGEVYIVGGISRALAAVRKVWLYKAANNTYTELGTIPGTMSPHFQTSIGRVGDNLYLMSSPDINILNLTTKVWTARTQPAYGTIYNFYGNAAITYNGYMYFFGPSTSPPGIILKRYDHVNNTWSTESTFLTTTNSGIYSKGVMVGNTAYFFGALTYSDKVIKYNFMSKAWTTITMPRQCNNNPGLAVWGNKILVTNIGLPGQVPGAAAFDGSVVAVYDTTTDTITDTYPISPPKLVTVITLLDDKLYLYGGQNKATSQPVPDVYIVKLV